MFNLNGIKKYLSIYQINIWYITFLLLVAIFMMPNLFGFLSSKFPCYFEYFSKYQTILAGLIALMAALITVLAMHRIEETKRVNKNYAARAMLNHALSEICEYLEKTAECLNKIQTDPKELIPQMPSAPKLPKYIYPWLSDAMEFSGKRAIVEYIANLTSELQIHSSRMRELESLKERPKENPMNSNYINKTLFQAFKIHSITSNLFDYSRGKTSYVLKHDSIKTGSLKFINILDKNDDLKKLIDNFNERKN